MSLALAFCGDLVFGPFIDADLQKKTFCSTVAQEFAPPSQDSFARYILLHIMARGSMPDGFLQGSVVDRDMGGERVIWGRVPI